MSGHWAKGYLGLAGDGPSMGDIEGINISNPQNGDTLVYNSSTGKWENGSGGGGGGSLVIHTGSGTLDKTWQERCMATRVKWVRPLSKKPIGMMITIIGYIHLATEVHITLRQAHRVIPSGICHNLRKETPCHPSR